MCQIGIIYGAKSRQPEEKSYLKWLFMYLLLLSERRGPNAAGIAWLKADGSHNIFKRPLRAVEFVKERQFVEVISQVNDNTTWLAGCASWPTGGVMEVGPGGIVGTHTGIILGPRFTEVDSELIFHIANATLHDGRIDVGAFKKKLSLCRGSISAVMASNLDPKTVVVVKGNMPLELRYSPRYKAIFYASDPAHLDIAFAAEADWEKISTRPMSIMTFRCDDLPEFESVPFRLAEGGGSYGIST